MRAVPPNRYPIFFSIAIAGCLVDLATKQWVFDWLGMPGGRTWWLWQDRVGIQTSLNPGALFGIGPGLVHAFSALSVIAAVAILVWLFAAGAARDRLLTVALGCVMAGILGNLYDRLGLPGLTEANGAAVFKVRDWILVMIFGWPWPNFNVADSMLLCGAALLVWHALTWDDGKRIAAADSAGEKSPQ